MLLGQVGRGATASRDENAAADAKFADEQDRLRDVITKAKIEGNTNVANAGIKALSELRMDHQNARTSGTSLLNTEENVKSRNQIANDNRAARAQADRHRQEDRAAALAGGTDKQQLAELKALQTSLKDQLKEPGAMGKAGDPLRAQLARVNMAIAKMAGLDTMGAAPGAGSPGGTSTSGWGKAQVVK